MTKETAIAEKIISYKGLDKDFKCRGFQYKVGETFKHDGEVLECSSGFHACEHPLDVLMYYPPTESRFAVVEQFGKLSRANDGSKVASEFISIMGEISIADLIKSAIEYTVSRCKHIDSESLTSNEHPLVVASTTGNNSTASNSGYQGTASTTGNNSTASNSGYKGTASSTGNNSTALSTDSRGTASTTGNNSAASNSGHRGTASTTGDYSAALNSGYKGTASTTGNNSTALNSGYQGTASTTGNNSTAITTGNNSAASSSGYKGTARANGHASVAVAVGYQSYAQAVEGSAIVLVFRDDRGNIAHIRASKVGENGIKAGVLYTLNEKGEFVEIC